MALTSLLMAVGRAGEVDIVKVEPLIAIRVDASEKIGTGHFMRCLTLADELKSHGARIRFVSRHLPDFAQKILGERGYECIILNSVFANINSSELAHANWLGCSQEDDAKCTVEALSDSLWDWIVVDHYALDAQWESALRNSAKKILVIDDLADRLHNCDILLDQNLHAGMRSRYANRVPSYCKLLLGTRYILLRREFQELKNSIKIRTGAVRRILVIFGGVDADNLTGLVLQLLENIQSATFKVDVVIGAQHPYREKIINDCSRLGYLCHLQIFRLAELMKNADLAIGACGFTSYEFAATRLPAILIPVSKIQESVSRVLSQKGVSHGLSLWERGSDHEISEALSEIINSDFRREAMSLACKDFLDMDGACRVANELLSGGVWA